MNTSDWLSQLTEEPLPDVAQRAGIAKRTLQHQVANDSISVENIVKIAAAYGVHPTRALIDWGIIGEEWATAPDVAGALRLATEEQLAVEVLRRMKVGLNSDVLTAPIDKLIGG